jgi:hypothetical protein
MKPIRSVAAFVIAGLIVAFGVAAVTALPAAAKAPVRASASSTVERSYAHAPSPAIDEPCAYHTDKFVTYTDGCAHWINWTCRAENEHPLNPAPDAVSNACAFDVELYSNSNYTGHTLCIGRDSRTGPLLNFWRSFRIISGSC